MWSSGNKIHVLVIAHQFLTVIPKPAISVVKLFAFYFYVLYLVHVKFLYNSYHIGRIVHLGCKNSVIKLFSSFGFLESIIF